MMRKITGFRGNLLFTVFVCMAAISSAGCVREMEEPAGQITEYLDEITIMHTDAGKKEFMEYIRQAEKKLNMKIHVLSYPINADSRHAKVSSLLAAGDSSVDVFTINDEMISQFKYAGYLEPLQDDVMNPETAAAFPQDYLEQMVKVDDQIYSAPFMMDILMPWVNERYLQEAGISDLSSKENFQKFLAHPWGDGRSAYGGAWEKTYVHNEIGEFIQLFGGDYYDWNHEKTREAVIFLKYCLDQGYFPQDQLIDQYEQMNQKLIDGTYGMVFMYSGSMNTYVDAGVYGEDHIHITSLPDLGEQTTFIATWQYALNKASSNKESAKQFIKYAISKEGSRDYAERMNRLPAREDIIWEETLDVTGFEEMRRFMKQVSLKARPMPENSMEYLSTMGELFQNYVTGSISLESYCSSMQNLVDQELPTSQIDRNSRVKKEIVK